MPLDVPDVKTLIDEFLEDQRSLTAVERFARVHQQHQAPLLESHYRHLIPLSTPRPGEQYAFEVDLDRCSGCKGCVTACHSLNGLDDGESWRDVGILVGAAAASAVSQRPWETKSHARGIPCSTESHASPMANALHQTVTTACHHCVEPGCLLGCPVLAYDKDPITGIVRHLDDQCIGCSYCILKCPYEVPKYSASRGIVRKCDMCHGRLAQGEAPACVQACPNEAIRITLVRPEVVRQLNADSVQGENPWLPDSPQPSITLPTTRYLTKRKSSQLKAADHDRLKPQPPHWPLVWMLLLTQMAVGLLAGAAALLFQPIQPSSAALLLAAWFTLHVGLAASVFHLGQPLRAWRAFLGWRTSWMSREIMAFGALSGSTSLALTCVGLSELGWVVPSVFLAGSTLTALGLGLLAVFTSVMIYVDTHRPCWNSTTTAVRFFGQSGLLGSAGAAVVAGWIHWLTNKPPGVAVAFAGIAFAIRSALFAWDRVSLSRALADPKHPRHRSAKLEASCFGAVLAWRRTLYVISTITGALAIGNLAGIGPLWATISLTSTLASSLMERFLFFAAAHSPKMPGIP